MMHASAYGRLGQDPRSHETKTGKTTAVASGLAARLRVGMKIWLAKYMRLTSATQSGGET